MLRRLAVCGGLLLGLTAWAQEEGPVAAWDFDEAAGPAEDRSGNGITATLRGAARIARGNGFALSFDGQDDYVDCGAPPALDLREALSLEAWIYPETVPDAEPMIVGKHFESYGFTMYKNGGLWFYISGGGNNLQAPVQLKRWTHVVCTFDGTTMALYLDGRLTASKQSKETAVKPGGNLLLGAIVGDPEADDPAAHRTAHWRGQLDDVAIYGRALTATEVADHYTGSAEGYGVDTTWLGRLRLSVWQFPDARRLGVLCDCSGVFIRPGDATVSFSLQADGGDPVVLGEVKPIPRSGLAGTELALPDLPSGKYTITATLAGAKIAAMEARQEIVHPPAPLQLPAPATSSVVPLPPEPGPADYTLQVQPGGGFVLDFRGRRLPVESSLSYPDAGDNKLAAGPVDTSGEPGWKVTTRELGGDAFEVVATGASYELRRTLRRLPGRIAISDTFINTTDTDLGIIIDNHLDATQSPWRASWVAGYPEGVERKEACSPSTFVAWDDAGLGIVPLDDVYVVQSIVYARGDYAGVRTEEFGLPAGGAYTLEWAVYPCSAPGYYDLVNRVRNDEGRRVTVEGCFAFIPRTAVTKEHLELRGVKYGSFGCLANVADDPEIEIEGIEFIELPKERARIREQFEAIRRVDPDIKLMFHVAHSLWSTNRPSEVFPDSRVIDADGNHVIYPYNYDACAYFSRARHEAGWRWYIYYPTPGNSFHEALMRSVDVMIDDIGCDGAFNDGYLWGYGSRYTYDRWDGHTVQIDPQTRRVKRRAGSVLLLSQPSMVEYTRKMNDKGAVVIANGAVMTRTIASLPIITDLEVHEGPGVHLAPTSATLGNPAAIQDEVDIYLDALNKLRWANLYFYYGEGEVTYPSLPREQYPITIRRLQEGVVEGEERIVTMNSGVYGWPGDDALHYCHHFNASGRSVPAQFLTTVEPGAVRTGVELESGESAVVVRLPATLTAQGPVNVCVTEYGQERLALLYNGEGEAELVVRKLKPGARYHLTGGARDTATVDDEGVLRVPIVMSGEGMVEVRADW